MRLTRIWIAFAVALAAAGCNGAAPKPEAARAIAWREGDVDDAFAEAKERAKPVFLYWGAKWCPPCNQLKSTLFKDPGFVAETRNFVSVYLDGDSPGAQRWGERFGISGYPTVIVLGADGSEITRLSSGSTADRLAEVLRVAAARTTSAETLLDRAEKEPGSLTADDWRLLAAFDWQNDPKHFGDAARTAALLGRLAEAAPDPAVKRRFGLLALVVGAERGKDGKAALNPQQQARLADIVPTIVADADEAKASRQELSYGTAPLIVALPDPERRRTLGASLVAALDRVHADGSLPLPDRLGTVEADIVLARADGGAVSPAVLAKVRERVAWADGSATDAMVRQSTISTAADLLHESGDDAGARKLLEAELKGSASPYYYMLDLARLAEDGKDRKGAIAWARKAYETAEGQATRVQWAIEYSKTVLRLAPDDKAAVEASAAAVIDELGKNADAYYQRTRVKVVAWGGLLRRWSEAHGGAALLARLDTRMAGVCAKQGTEAASCRKWRQTA